MDKSLGTLLRFWGFSIHTGSTPPFTPQTMLDACIQNFSEIQLCIGWGEGELQENFENDAVLRGSREMTGKYAYCSTVPRTFVHDQSWTKVLGHFCVSGIFFKSHRSNPSPHPTNNVGRVYPDFFERFNFV